MTVEEFVKRCRQYVDFPTSEILGWLEVAERNDGKDQYGRTLRKRQH